MITIKCKRITENKTTISYTPVDMEFGGLTCKNNSKVKIDRATMTITMPEEYAAPKTVRAPAPAHQATPLESAQMALEVAADRAQGNGASRAQTAYLARLIVAAGETAAQAGYAITNSSAVLTSARASALIDTYK